MFLNLAGPLRKVYGG